VGPTYYEDSNNDTMDYPRFKIFVRLSIAFSNEWGTRIPTTSLVHAPFEDLVRKLARNALDVDPKFQNLFSPILKLRR